MIIIIMMIMQTYLLWVFVLKFTSNIDLHVYIDKSQDLYV